MKIRQGFVSNSSSSSYIIKIRDVSFREFADLIATHYAWSCFCKPALIREIQDFKIKKSKVSVETHCKLFQANDLLKKQIEDENKALISKYEKIIEKIKNSESSEELVKVVFDYRDIGYKIIDDYDIELSDFTSMHNSFNEGMSDLMKEIALFLIFDTNYRVIFTRDARI